MKAKIIFLLFFILLYPTFIFATDQININSASLSQLDELTGIGSKYAQAIIDARPFSSVDDLSRVKGIGSGTRLQKIKDQGLACVDCTNSNTQVADNKIVSTTYSNKIYINEILPNPTGSDETDEWIELYNSNSAEVDLSGWQIQDTAGIITTFTIPQNTKIIANGFLVFKRPETKIMLNNDEDGLNLLTPDKNTVDSVNYTKASLNQSYNKNNSGWAWSTTLTPGAINIITAVATKTTAKTLPKTKKSVNNKNVEAGLADLSQNITNQETSQNNNPWFLFFTALGITIILAVIVLIIKLKFLKNYVRT